ncbi:MAG: hypothetical protein AAGA76_00125 [Pseudomonadota bacterium]
MSSIESYIRSAILKSGANSPETRNEIYLAAREAIGKLPEEKAQVAMQQLFETVKTIEAEFVRKDMADHSKDVLQVRKRQSPLFPLRIKIPWTTVGIVTVIILIMVFSASLLFEQFQNGSDPKRNASATTVSVNSVTSIFTVSRKTDIEKLSSDARGIGSVATDQFQEGDSRLWFKDILTLYGKEPLSLEKDGLYHVQLRLQLQPKTAALTLNAGFASFNKNTAEIARSFFLNLGKIKPGSYRVETDEYAFSSILTLEDLQDNLNLGDENIELRPVILADADNDDTRILLKAFSIDRLP